MGIGGSGIHLGWSLLGLVLLNNFLVLLNLLNLNVLLLSDIGQHADQVLSNHLLLGKGFNLVFQHFAPIVQLLYNWLSGNRSWYLYGCISKT